MPATAASRSARRGVVALIAVSLVCAAAVLRAQPANPFIGSWQAKFLVSTARGLMDERQADLVITPTGGTWQTRVQSRTDPCIGREVPLHIDELTDSRLTGTLRFSSLADFCKDLKLVLQVDASGTVVGRRGNTELSLERK